MPAGAIAFFDGRSSSLAHAISFFADASSSVAGANAKLVRTQVGDRYVVEAMRHGRLFLAGYAAHVVPPTGAKGLNLAVSDGFSLARALGAFYSQGATGLLDSYSDMALRRVWSSVRISWYLTTLLHRFPGATDFDQRAQEYELEYLNSSHHAQVALAEQYAGLPFEGAG